MAKQVINIGTTANDGTGDPLRTAYDKSNQNFTELYDKTSNVDNTADSDKPVSTAQAAADSAVLDAANDYTDSGLATKQDTLVSGTNIKTINGTPVLGSGDIVISGGGGGSSVTSFGETFGGKDTFEFASIYPDACNWTAQVLGSEIAQLMYSMNGGVYTTPSFPVAIPANARMNYKIVLNTTASTLTSFHLKFTLV